MIAGSGMIRRSFIFESGRHLRRFVREPCSISMGGGSRGRQMLARCWEGDAPPPSQTRLDGRTLKPAALHMAAAAMDGEPPRHTHAHVGCFTRPPAGG